MARAAPKNFGESQNHDFPGALQLLARIPTANQKRLKLDSALYATYNFDDAGRLSNIVNASDSSTITFGYDNEDKMISRAYPNGVTTTYEYYNNDLLKRLKDFNSTATLFDRQYTFNTANQIETLTDNSGTRTFGYDLVDRLKTVSVGGTQTEFYNYDDVGNRTSSHLSSTYGYATGKFNQMASTATASYQFDANGNTIRKSEGKDFWRYTWDGENRLTEAATRKQKVRYRYDALGRRVRRYTPGVREDTKFTNDGLDVLIDDDAGTLTKYLNGPGIDNKLRVQNGGTVNYFLADHLGSTNGLTDGTGSLTSQASYDSFGNQTGSLATRYQFTGREYDNFTNQFYYRARFYESKLGRFSSEDPIGFHSGDVNYYAYLDGSPLLKIDPYGTFGLCKELDGTIVPCPAPLSLQKMMDGLACKIDGYNPWLTLEVGGGVQFGPLGGADGLVFGFNPLTGEFTGQTKLMSGAGGATGMMATAGAQVGVSLGPYRSGITSSGSAELFVDAAAFGGGSGSISYDGGLGSGLGIGPVIGGGAAAGLRIGENTPLFSTTLYPKTPYICNCKGK
ncbi:MAG: RHS repeat-associated core domain-containing protein [Acidobacteria bacterium]|nr:RHS repeat-associated core domain-containing protein [Acidobacteriota bacterium]